MRRTFFLTLLLTFHPTAGAYIGPGLGAGAIGVIIGILGSLLLAMFAILWYPIKKFYKRWFPPPTEKKPSVPDNEEGETSQ